MHMSHLKAFLLVAKTQNFTKAAELGYTSQPTLSRAVAMIEEEVGVPLFDRTKNGIRLNKFGQEFLLHVKSGLDTIDEGVQSVRHMYSAEDGVLYLGDSGHVTIVSALMKGYGDQNPKLRLNHELYSYNEGVHRLLQGETDCLFTIHPPGHVNIKWDKIGKVSLCLIVHKEADVPHSEWGTNAVDLADLQNNLVPFVLPPSGYECREVFDLFCRNANFKPRVVGESIKMLFADSLGLGKIIGIAFRPEGYDLALPPGDPRVQYWIKNEKNSFDLGIATLRDHNMSLAANDFFQFAAERFMGT